MASADELGALCCWLRRLGHEPRKTHAGFPRGRKSPYRGSRFQRDVWWFWRRPPRWPSDAESLDHSGANKPQHVRGLSG
jgi:hypothetical protein